MTGAARHLASTSRAGATPGAAAPRRAGARGRAFSLAEIIVALVIIGLIGAAVIVSVLRLNASRDAAAARRQANQRAQAALALILRDLGSVAREDDPARSRVFIEPGGGGPAPDGSAAGARASVRVVAHAATPVRATAAHPEAPTHEVSFRLLDGPITAESPEAAAAQLWRRADPNPDEYLDAGGVAAPVVSGIAGLAVEAADQDFNWLSSWDSDLDGMPQAVRVTVTAVGSAGGRGATATARGVASFDRTPLPTDPVALAASTGQAASSTSGLISGGADPAATDPTTGATTGTRRATRRPGGAQQPTGPGATPVPGAAPGQAPGGG
ncbi:MAG: hypothetical protein C0468_04860, partial [Planctomyces sp.]|nr:hypothetical protein [Planctomyces sp.]